MSKISAMQSGRIVWLSSLTKLFLFSLRAFQRGPPPAKPFNDRRSDRNSRRIIRENARAVLLRRVIVTYDRIPVKADWIIPPRRGESSSSRRLQPTWRYAKFGSDPRNCFLRIHRSIDRSATKSVKARGIRFPGKRRALRVCNRNPRIAGSQTLRAIICA